MELRGFELMAIAAWRLRIEGFRQRISKVLTAEREALTMMSLFARKPQISLAFVPQESNGRDVLKGAPGACGVTRR